MDVDIEDEEEENFSSKHPNYRLNTQPLSKHMIHQWAMDTMTASVKQGATKNLWGMMDTQRHSAIDRMDR